MRSRLPWHLLLVLTATVSIVPRAAAGEVTLSHTSTALPGASGPVITLLSITGNNDGTNYIFTLTFANPTISGPSSGQDDAVYGFINIDADQNAATGARGVDLDSHGYQSGFGQFSPASQGIEAYVNLSSEGDPVGHSGPNQVDVVSGSLATGFNPIDTVSIQYLNQAGATPSMLTLTIPLSDFTDNQIALLDTGHFSVVVGNVNNATDFLPSATAVPEPSSLVLIAMGLSLTGMATARSKPGQRRRAARRQP